MHRSVPTSHRASAKPCHIATLTTLHLSSVLLLGASLLWWTTPAWACSCASNPPLEMAYENGDIIVIGRVDQVGPSPLKKGQKEIKIIVQNWIKGKDVVEGSKGNSILVYTANDEAQCGFSFFQEQDYIIFAKGTPANLRTDICSGTILLDNGLALVDKLMKLSGQ